MPRVPTRPDQVVEPSAPRTQAAPTVFQQVKGATADAFGAAEGRALEQVGEALRVEGARHAKASDRIARRQQALARVRILSDTREKLRVAFETVQDTGDNFGTRGSVAAFRTQSAQIVTQAGALMGNDPVLMAALIREQARIDDKAIDTGAIEARAANTRAFNQRTVEISGQVFNGDISAAEANASLDEELLQYVDSTTPDELGMMRNAGREANAVAAFNRIRIVGTPKEIREVFNDTQKFMSKGVRDTARNRMIVGETAQAKSDAEVAAKTARVKRALDDIGEEMTPAIILGLEGVTLPKVGQTPAEKIAEIAAIRGQANRPPMTEAQITKLEGTYIKEQDAEENVFGRGAKGLAAAKIASEAGEFANRRNGEDPEADRFFIMSVALLLQPDVLGIRGVLGPVARAALDRRNIDPDKFQQGELTSAMIDKLFGLSTDEENIAAPDEPTVLPSLTSAPEPTAAPGAEDQPGVGEAAANAPDATINDKVRNSRTLGPIFSDQAPDVFGPFKTIFEVGGVFTGPLPFAREIIGRAPLIGRGGGVSTRIRRGLPIVFNRLVNALRVNVRSETERQNLLTILSVDPKIFDNKFAFQQRMLGVDDGLRAVAELAATAMKGRTSADQQKRDIDLIQMITEFRGILMPPRVEGATEEEVEKNFNAFAAENPPGTRFLMKDLSGEWQIFPLPETAGKQGE